LEILKSFYNLKNLKILELTFSYNNSKFKYNLAEKMKSFVKSGHLIKYELEKNN